MFVASNKGETMKTEASGCNFWSNGMESFFQKVPNRRPQQEIAEKEKLSDTVSSKKKHIRCS